MIRAARASTPSLAVARSKSYGYAWAIVKPQIMYIDLKSDGSSGEARLGRVEFSQTGKTLYYAGRTMATGTL